MTAKKFPYLKKRYISNSITMNEVHITACQPKCTFETSKHSNCWAALGRDQRRWSLFSCSFHCNPQSPVNYVAGNLHCLIMSHSAARRCVSVPIRTDRTRTLISGRCQLHYRFPCFSVAQSICRYAKHLVGLDEQTMCDLKLAER